MMPTEGQRPVQATFVYPHIPPQPQIVQRTEAHKGYWLSGPFKFIFSHYCSKTITIYCVRWKTVTVA